jgi:hypothetical protein
MQLVVRARVGDHGPIRTEDYETVVSTRPEWEWPDPVALRAALAEYVPEGDIGVGGAAFRATKTTIEDALKKAGLKPKARAEAFEKLFTIGKVKRTTTVVTVGRVKHERPKGEALEDV